MKSGSKHVSKAVPSESIHRCESRRVQGVKSKIHSYQRRPRHCFPGNSRTPGNSGCFRSGYVAFRKHPSASPPGQHLCAGDVSSANMPYLDCYLLDDVCPSILFTFHSSKLPPALRYACPQALRANAHAQTRSGRTAAELG